MQLQSLTADIRNTLSTHVLFKDLSEETFKKLWVACVGIKAKKGETLFLHGEEAENFYFILDGWVRLSRITEDGDEATLDMVSVGRTFGDVAGLQQETYSYSATTTTETKMVRLPNDMWVDIIQNDHKTALNVILSMSNKYKQQLTEKEHINFQTASQRIGCFMLKLCDQDANDEQDIFLPYDKSLIASNLSMKGETFSRALKTLKNETGISVSGKTVSIPSVEALSTYTCNACAGEFPCGDHA
ncbi:Crp/Fnr family transcriptional regulator [Kordiimonas sp. SCSIO 12610]|uniref:Crp/Fnr family transcriptional regulator n=1 Tax=Kordiimonas sp. SCSIO 12610 TaxID=2829597 RepID=UPI00210D9F1A|nr:Crp/Fnr family transcriptional regulator [Kordiimonas sp. SCSIO 12610]UTW55595.1 Crp/Fnr family transcriptional regulator [Kordiimonas sp. SCSIO 12610]